jgi:hypothetical protein
METNPTKAKATAPNTELAAIAMPPRMARKMQAATDRMEQLMKSPAQVQKEFARLNALISKLTASTDQVKPKQRYFDETGCARWGMSVKHGRNLRSTGVGPQVTYFGRSVRYRLRDIVAFEKANAFASRTAKEQAQKS